MSFISTIFYNTRKSVMISSNMFMKEIYKIIFCFLICAIMKSTKKCVIVKVELGREHIEHKTSHIYRGVHGLAETG